MCHRASLEGSQHLGMPCLFPSLPLLGLGLLQISWVDFLRGESFCSLPYPVLLQPESQASLGQGADPQAG